MSASETSESTIVENLLPKYQADGFDVYVNPSPSILPPFMQDYRPDAIALKKDKKIAIEVVRSATGVDRKVRDITSLFADHPEWELQVFYAAPLSPDASLHAASAKLIGDSIQRILELRLQNTKCPPW